MQEGDAGASRQACIERPTITFDPEDHVYTVNGERALGVSTVAKVGEDVWSAASAWGWRIGRDGALTVLAEHPDMDAEDVDAEMARRGLTPWATRDKAAYRGTDVHDVLEQLVQDGTTPDLDRLEPERRGHALSLLRWYRRFRPSFVAAEVIVGSGRHGFAGRYDLRALIDADRMRDELDAVRPALELLGMDVPDVGELLCLLDLKTSKRVVRKFLVQLDGYEEGSVEMGYPESDLRGVIRTRPDGECAELVLSWAPRGVFLDCLTAAKGLARCDWYEPRRIRKRQREAEQRAQEDRVEAALAEHGPTTSRKLAVPLRPMEPAAISKVLQRLKRQGRASCSGRTWSVRG